VSVHGGERIALMPIAALGEGERRVASTGGLELLLFCIEGRIYAVENRCSHAAARLEAGRLRNHQITCPMHGARFDVRSGACEARPATRPIRTFDVELEGGKINVVVS
jgi:nitrite reductase/ring-hydroxylating ferredoxin subunit